MTLHHCLNTISILCKKLLKSCHFGEYAPRGGTHSRSESVPLHLPTKTGLWDCWEDWPGPGSPRHLSVISKHWAPGAWVEGGRHKGNRGCWLNSSPEFSTYWLQAWGQCGLRKADNLVWETRTPPSQSNLKL